jgi:hypothetical protein
MKSITIAISVLLAVMSMPAAANECALDTAKVDATLRDSATPATRDELSRAKSLRDSAVALCAAGDVNGGLALLAEAKTILKIR